MLKMSSRRPYDESGVMNLNKYLKERCEHTCEHCGKQYPREVLEFHHKEPFVKKFSPGVLYWRGAKVEQKVLDEAAICMVLCANCHRLEHVRLKNEGSSTGHRDGRPEPEEDLGDSREGLGQQTSLNFEESNS